VRAYLLPELCLWTAQAHRAGTVLPIGFHDGRHVDDGLSAKVGAVQREQEFTRE
jgi:hypothetical protein